MSAPVPCRGFRGRSCSAILAPDSPWYRAGICLDCIRALRLEQVRRGLEHPVQRALAKALSALAISADCANAFVLDARGVVLSQARSGSDEELKQVVTVTTSALRVLKPALIRGGKLDRVWRLHIDAYLHSFDSAYVLFVLHAGAFDANHTRDAVLADLPRIASLTSKLPPPGGAGPSADEAFGLG